MKKHQYQTEREKRPWAFIKSISFKEEHTYSLIPRLSSLRRGRA